MTRRTTTERGYGWEYQQARARLLADGPACHWCGVRATTADHVPPLGRWPTRSTWTGVLVPACGPCNFGRRGGRPKPRRLSGAEHGEGGAGGGGSQRDAVWSRLVTLANLPDFSPRAVSETPSPHRPSLALSARRADQHGPCTGGCWYRSALSWWRILSLETARRLISRRRVWDQGPEPRTRRTAKAPVGKNGGPKWRADSRVARVSGAHAACRAAMPGPRGA